MLKNKGKGGKNQKQGRNETDNDKRELFFKEDGQKYALVTRMPATAAARHNTKNLCHIRGKMLSIVAGVIVLIGLCDYHEDKADAILEYMNDKARLLKACNELPNTLRLNEGVDINGSEEGEGDSDYI